MPRFNSITTKSVTGLAQSLGVARYQLLQAIEAPGQQLTLTFGGNPAVGNGTYTALPLPLWDNLQANSGRVYQYRNSDWSLVRVYENPNTNTTSDSDYFGQSVAMSDSYLFVGAYNEDTVNFADSGVVYVFDLETGEQVATINNPDVYNNPTDSGDQFGWFVAVKDDELFVSAISEDQAGSPASLSMGAVYIFDSVPPFNQRHVLVDPNAYSGTADNFGYNIAVSDSYLTVGARNEQSVAGVNFSGAYYSYVRAGGYNLGDSWSIGNPNIDTSNGADDFVRVNNMVMNDQYVIVGASLEDRSGEGITNTGVVYVFDVTDRSLGINTPVQTLTNPNYDGTENSDSFGVSLALYGNTLAVGAQGEQLDDSTNAAGAVYLYDIRDWSLIDTIINPSDQAAGDLFGSTVAFSGNQLIIGAAYDGTTGNLRGRFYVYAPRIDAQWRLTSLSGSTVNEGSAVSFALSTPEIADGTVMYWTAEFDTAAADDLIDASGSFVVNNRLGLFDVDIFADSTTETPAESFIVRVRMASVQGQIVATSGVISINDTSQTPVVGQQAYTTPGTYSWTVPEGVTSVSVVAVGAGGSGGGNGGGGGGGGGLGWRNNIPVTPGESVTVVVGNVGSVSIGNGGAGGQSYFKDTSTVSGGGGSGGRNSSSGGGGTYTGDGGGNGGSGGIGHFYDATFGSGGGGAGGYSGNGGNGGKNAQFSPLGVNEDGAPGSGGAGGGGGGAGGSQSNTFRAGAGGGGVGILGQGSDGAGGSRAINLAAALGGSGGSGGGNGADSPTGTGGLYGGGGAGAGGSGGTTGRVGGAGAVRIIWGPGRAFPSTNTADV